MNKQDGMHSGMVAGAGKRWACRVVAVGAVTAAALGVAPGIASASPRNPSDSQINAAEQSKAEAAKQVGAISAQLATAQTSVDDAHAASAIALDTFQGKEAEYEDAQTAASTAATAARKADADLAVARDQVAGFARTSYISGSTSPSFAALMSSDGPAQLMERHALLDSAGGHRSDVLVQVSAAQQRAAASKLAATTALKHAAALKRQAEQALAVASQAEAAARSKAAAVQAQRVTLQAQLEQAQRTLLGLQGARAAAARYAAEQAAAAKAERDAEARAAARANDTQSNDTQGNAPAPSAPSAGAGSSSAAQTAISAAMRWIGTRYAWGGGSLGGPSEGWGIDAGVVGFDCSGLTRYAYAQAGIVIARNSTRQYATLPKVSRSDLQAGDLVFWATDTSNAATIHHVALYLGGGQILEAPESGLRVRITSMRWRGYIGAVRPSA